MDEGERVRKVARGDRAAFSELAQAYMPAIERYVLRLSADPFLAEDLAQDTLLKLWLQADQFDPSRGRLTTWLHRIAHNLVRDSPRRSASWQSIEQRVEHAIGSDHDTAHDDPADGRSARVSASLMALPERQRSALVLSYYQDLSNREVAQVMGVSVRALESLLVRARLALKRQLGVIDNDR